MSSGFSALENRAFRVVWATETVSFVGNFVHLTAQSWLLLRMTNSPMAFGRLSVAFWTPSVLLSLFGGALADRIPPRTILVLTQVISAIIAMLLAALVFTDRLQLWEIYVLAALRGSVLAFEIPAYNVFIVSLIGPEVLPSAMALSVTTYGISRIVGTAIGGFAIANLGSAGAFVFNSLSFIPCALAYAFLRLPGGESRPRPKAESLMVRLKEGLLYARRSDRIAMLLLLGFLIALFGDNTAVVVPMIAKRLLRVTPETFGIMTSCVGAGSMAAAVLMARTRDPSLRLVFASAVTVAVVLALLGLSRWYLVSCALLALGGAAMVVFTIAASSIVTVTTPHELRGRVSSIRLVLGSLSAPVGGYLTGAVATLLGVRASLAALGATCALGILFSYAVGAAIARREKARA